MYKKKGMSAHLDWVIGGALFLVYLALVFVFFKPGVTPVFDDDTLIDVAEQNFMGYATDETSGVIWNISKM